MLLLGFESSAKSASVALMRDGEIIAETFLNSGLTHSKTLLPIAEDLLRRGGHRMDEIDLFAVSNGPGSFTGIRIGISCVKGLCWATEKPAVGVSTLYAMAQQALMFGEGETICCVMDARRNQVYNALFTVSNGKILRLCPDRAISLEELYGEISEMGRKTLFVGDGAELSFNFMRDKLPNAFLAPTAMRHQRASGVCLAALEEAPVNAGELLPIYLRLSQAERERQQKLNNKEI